MSPPALPERPVASAARERPADAPLPGLVEVPPAEREELLDVARACLAVAAGAARRAPLDQILRRCASPRRAAVFVTLTEDGDLRGCMGLLDPDGLLPQAVARAAVLAATGDPRFERVAAVELPRLQVEISVLGPLVPLADPEAFRLGVDGIVVERGDRRGLLLPEVAGHGLGRVAMLETASRKAGLPAGAWRDTGTSLHVFRTCRFGGPAVVSPVSG